MGYPIETKARAIVDAALTTDREAAEKHGCNRKSIERWRSNLDTNPDLQARCAELWEEVRQADNWVDDATDTIRTALSFLRTAFDELAPSDPKSVEAVNQAIQTLTVLSRGLFGSAGSDLDSPCPSPQWSNISTGRAYRF